jgi:competence ComEA-like helix-hairpin-helix protein
MMSAKSYWKSLFFYWTQLLGISRLEVQFMSTVLMLVTLVHVGISYEWFYGKPFDYTQEFEAFDEKVRMYLAQQDSVDAARDSTNQRSDRVSRGILEGVSALDSIRIEMNEANLEDWVRLPGIGEVYAQRIMSYRHQVNGFSSVEQLLEVKGIGEKRFQKLKPMIYLREDE